MEVGRWVGGWLAGEAVGSALNDMGQTGSIGWRKETGGYFVSTAPRVCWRLDARVVLLAGSLAWQCQRQVAVDRQGGSGSK